MTAASPAQGWRRQPPAPDLPPIPGIPQPPSLPDWPEIPGLPELPKIPGLPDLPSPEDLCDLPTGPQELCDLGEDLDRGRELIEEGRDAVGSLPSLDRLAESAIDGFGSTLQTCLTWWTKLPSPALTAEDGSPGPVLERVLAYTTQLQVLMLIAGCLFAAGRLALAQRGALAGEAQETILMVGRAVLAASLMAAIVTSSTRAGDAFSQWVIDDASAGDADAAVERMIRYDLLHSSGLGTMTLIIIGVLGAISALVQLVALVIRQAVLILVVAVLPIAASAAGTGPGGQAYKRLLSWSLAFILWKPVGSLIYAIAFTAVGSPDSDAQTVLLGLILLVMVVLALPALVALVAPAVTAMGGGGGGAAATLAGAGAGVLMARTGSRSGGARTMSEQTGHPPGPSGSGPSGSGPSGSGPSGGGPSDGGGPSGSGVPAGPNGAGTASAGSGSGTRANTATAPAASTTTGGSAGARGTAAAGGAATTAATAGAGAAAGAGARTGTGGATGGSAGGGSGVGGAAGAAAGSAVGAASVMAHDGIDGAVPGPWEVRR
ncbi:hypothetical protein [Nocardia puris]|uniref:hypothetical protein n=1 Tax=Nocardia puris TaxID=208602 RepID=UPI002E2380E8